MTIFLGHSHPVPKYELSSRPERSEVEGPAVRSISTQRLTEAPPYPLSSRAQPRDLRFRGPFLEMFFDRAQQSGSAVQRAHLGNVFRRSPACASQAEPSARAPLLTTGAACIRTCMSKK